jgi:hypothetical protein
MAASSFSSDSLFLFLEMNNLFWQKILNHLFTKLNHFGQFKPVLTESNRFKNKQVYKTEQVWTKLNKLGQNWTSLDKAEQVQTRTSLDKTEQVWTKLNKFRHYWTSLDTAEQV